MKKLLSIFLTAIALILFSTTTLASASTMAFTEEPVLENSNTFIDENLVGTKIDVPMTKTGGYLYKNINFTKSNDTKTYIGKVTKTTSVSFGVNLAKGYITLGIESSASREYKEYRHKADFKATWGVYDKYSGKYMYSTTTSQKGLTYYSYARIK